MVAIIFQMEGPVIVVPNHLSNNDPLSAAMLLPRHVHFMAKQELFVNPFHVFVHGLVHFR